jgi:protein phosphatase
MTHVVHPRARSVDQRHDTGPFDVIGDVHGCGTELEMLLARLGYDVDSAGLWRSPAGRTPVFVGDFVDRGPRIADTLRIAMRMVAAGVALAVPGNHDMQFARRLAGEDVPVVYGMDTSLAAVAAEPDTFRADVVRFFEDIKGHYVLDRGRLVVAHTGLAESLHGVDTWESRQMAIYGVLEGEIDAVDITRRHSWLPGYQGTATVVYGHTPVSEAVWHRNTIDVDTGCVFGGSLTALRWPERELMSVRALDVYHRRGG